MKKKLLIVRSQNQAEELVLHLQNHDFEVFVEPVVSVKKFAFNEASLKKKCAVTKIAGIILTSANAAEMAFEAIEILGLGKKIKIFAVGKKTAKKFIDHNFENVFWPKTSSAQDLEHLILANKNLSNEKDHKNLLYFCGEIVTRDLKTELAKSGIAVEKIVAYKTVKEQNFSEKFLQQIQNSKFDFVLFYSKNSAKHFVDLATKYNLLEYFQASKILCLSEKIRSGLCESGFKNLANFDEISILKKFYD